MTKFRRVNRVNDFGGFAGSGGGARFEGSFPDNVCERAIVVYPTEECQSHILLKIRYLLRRNPSATGANVTYVRRES